MVSDSATFILGLLKRFGDKVKVRVSISLIGLG